jgi:integrator complex subunit 11
VVVQVMPGITVRALYAGHVLGAAMLHLQIDGTSILYTGEFNMEPPQED